MTPDEKIDEIIERYPEFWKTKSSYMSYIRGGVRQGLWNRNKIKLLKIKNNRVQIPNPNPKGKKETVWGGECEVCKNLFPTASLQVDHIRDKGSSLKNFSDVSKFIEDMILITEDDLRIVCKSCHEIISHSQKKDCSFEEARVQKEFIEIKKQKKVVDKLISLGVNSIPKLKKDQESLCLKLMLEIINEN
ncbi:HNH endonuclease [Acinetobacter phage TaPaz]|nr:HNH endonuclease [Acinetobacter phage TaPaz]